MQQDSLEPGTELGQATRAFVIDMEQDVPTGDDVSQSMGKAVYFPAEVKTIPSEGASGSRSKKLEEILERGETRLRPEEQGLLRERLEEYHDAFSLEPSERGETDLVQFQIETGGATPKKQPPRRMPFGARKEVARQLKEMQDFGVVQQPMVQSCGVSAQEGWHTPVLHGLPGPQHYHQVGYISPPQD